MEKIIEYGSDQIRIFCTVKGRIPAFLTPYLMRGNARMICDRELSFGCEETMQLLSRITGMQQNGQIAKKIQEYTEGWPAGIVFEGLSLRNGQEKNKQYLYDYIYYEIFRKLSNEIQQFLIDISVFEEPEPLICNYVLERSDAEVMLDDLVQEQQFLYRLEGERKCYRCHTLFAAFLRSRLDHGKKEKLLQKAAEYLAHHGRWEESVRFAVSCGEKGYEIVSTILKKRLPDMLTEEHINTLKQWILYLNGRKERLAESTLFLIYRFYRYGQQEEEGMKILYEAAERAYELHRYEVYAGYMCELIEYCRKIRGIISAEEFAREAERKLLGQATSFCSRIVCYCVEFRLQLEDENELRTFLELSSDRERRHLYHLNETRRMVRWALDLENSPVKWEELLEQARFTVRLSKVYAEYGFYRVAYQLYRKKSFDWSDTAKEGVQIGGESTFSHWMQLLLYLDEYKRGDGKKNELATKIKSLEAYRIWMGMDFPELLPEDTRNLEIVLMETHHKRTIDVPEKEIEENHKGPRSLLCIKCLGSFFVEGKEGGILWRTKKARELFACLFYEEGRGITKDTLMERLWPQSGVKSTSSLFDTTLSYMRKALAKADAADVLMVQNGTYALNMHLIASDIQELMNWKEISLQKELPEHRNTLEAARLYHDCYMQGEDYIWLGEYCEYMEQIFLQTIKRLAEMEMQKGGYEKAVLLMQKAVEVDSYGIPLAELLVECLILEGNIKGAKKQYTRIGEICKTELGEELELEFGDYVKKAYKFKKERAENSKKSKDCELFDE